MRRKKTCIVLFALALCILLVNTSCGHPANIQPAFNELPSYQDNLDAISPSAYSKIQGLNLAPGTYISVIGKENDSIYWETVKKGVLQAEKDLNEELGYTGEEKIKVVYNAPRTPEDIDEQVNILDEELARNPDAVAIASIDEDAYTVQFDLAIENGVSIVALDSKNHYSEIQCTVQTDNEDAAHTGAYKLADEIGAKGELLLLIHNSRTSTSREREDAFLKKIRDSYPDITQIHTIYFEEIEEEKSAIAEKKNADLKDGGRTFSAEDFSNEDVILYYLQENPEIRGIFGTDFSMTELGLSSLRQAEDGRDIILMGFDESAELIRALENGEVSGLVVQNPFGIGYASVVAAARSILGTGNEPEVNTGYLWVTKENLQSESIQNMLYE